MVRVFQLIVFIFFVLQVSRYEDLRQTRKVINVKIKRLCLFGVFDFTADYVFKR